MNGYPPTPHELLTAILPGGIETLERQGQGSLARRGRVKIPKRMDQECRAALLKAGVTFAEDIDELFMYADVPTGWSVGPQPLCDNSYWSGIFDARGRQRTSIFYKAAFYDCNADMHICHKWCEAKLDARDGKWVPQVRAGLKIIWEGAPMPREAFHQAQANAERVLASYVEAGLDVNNFEQEFDFTIVKLSE